ncbi:hypothetical protein [Nonomuraea endophytica]|uniref:Uncharacterized protein n=1 Tax=Nonomuraea endophytica TaxID=714136 RepID=A0A7W8EJ94_9ACTN|nr:hypothetical protein [Nonomuraea endophytica]MBB5081296.1 hypothetical protein [Nonomuraea endophytica]
MTAHPAGCPCDSCAGIHWPPPDEIRVDWAQLQADADLLGDLAAEFGHNSHAPKIRGDHTVVCCGTTLPLTINGAS